MTSTPSCWGAKPRYPLRCVGPDGEHLAPSQPGGVCQGRARVHPREAMASELRPLSKARTAGAKVLSFPWADTAQLRPIPPQQPFRQQQALMAVAGDLLRQPWAYPSMNPSGSHRQA